ncbi:hypothetical protein [Atrimonas thermophila]|uniref:hypothetical protein n=1 Tax=Atrimonas thermophila TaxID=3064161 RepID=UPI00399D09CB
MRFWRVLVLLVLFLFLLPLLLGGCGQQTTTPETQEETETQEEASTETQEEAAQGLDFVVWPGTIRAFESDPDGITTLETTRPAFVLFPSPELAQRLGEDPGAEPIALSITGSEQGGGFLEVAGVQVFYLFANINVATPFQVGYRFPDGSTILETVTFDPATNVFRENNAISIKAGILSLPVIGSIPPIPPLDVHHYLGVDIEHPQGCYHLRNGSLNGTELFEEETSFPTPQEETFSFLQEIPESENDEELTLEVYAMTVYENLGNYSYQNPPSQPFSITISTLEENLSDLPFGTSGT